MADGLRNIKMWEQMQGTNSSWGSIWQECSDWCLPHKDNITQVRTGGQDANPQRMTDTCIEANFNFASGFYSYMFPPSSVWAKFKHPNAKMMEEEGVGEYYETVSRMIHRVILESNFAQEVQESLLDLGCFGTNNIYVEEDDKDVIRLRSFTVADYRIKTNNKGKVDTVARMLKLDARQMHQEFGEEALIKADLGYIMDHLRDGTNDETKYEVVHIVEPRTDYNKSKMDVSNKPWASTYTCMKTKNIIKESGYDYNPYFVGRFALGNGEDWGRSPMMMILATARRTNTIYRSMIVSAEQHGNPQWLMPDDDSVSFKGNPNRAGAMLYYNATGGASAKPERLAPNGDPNVCFEMYQFHDTSIKKAFFNPLFRPLEDVGRQMSATETNARMSTDLMALAPFVNRYQDEVVSPLLTYLYYLMNKQGKLPELPLALQDDPEFEIEYIGKISLATKSFEVMGAFQTIQMFAEAAQYLPSMGEALIAVDAEDLLRETWYANGGSMRAIKSEKDVEAEKAANAQAAEKQQAIDNAPQLARAYKDGSAVADEGSMSQAAGEAIEGA